MLIPLQKASVFKKSAIRKRLIKMMKDQKNYSSLANDTY